MALKRKGNIFGLSVLIACLLPECDSPDPAGTRYAGLAIENNSEDTIRYLYVTPAGNDSYGPDQLAGEYITPGTSFSLTDVPPGTYDITVVGAQGNVVTDSGIPLSAGEMHTWVLTVNNFMQYGALEVVNNSMYAIGYLFVSPSTSSSWGDDYLGSTILEPGRTFLLETIPPGKYDMMAVTHGDGNLKAKEMGALLSAGVYRWTLETSNFGLPKKMRYPRIW